MRRVKKEDFGFERCCLGSVFRFGRNTVASSTLDVFEATVDAANRFKLWMRRMFAGSLPSTILVDQERIKCLAMLVFDHVDQT